MKLIIGNKNYSSWSLRPWLLLSQAKIPFKEENLSFNATDFGARVRRYSAGGRVPILVDDDVTVWDSLAICEYVAEKFPDKQLWPAERTARATARSMVAEMHSSFQALRSRMPMNCSARFPGMGWDVTVQRDIDRILALWTEARRFGDGGGPFLFGDFSVADAYFAPVTVRFLAYDVKLPPLAQRYLETLHGERAMQAWLEAARIENDFVAANEPYRLPPQRR